MSEKEEIRDVRKAHRFDEAVLADYLKEHLDDFSGKLSGQAVRLWPVQSHVFFNG